MSKLVYKRKEEGEKEGEREGEGEGEGEEEKNKVTYSLSLIAWHLFSFSVEFTELFLDNIDSTVWVKGEQFTLDDLTWLYKRLVFELIQQTFHQWWLRLW